MDKTQKEPKKSFCTRCFLPIDGENGVTIEGQNFHRFCGMCSICHTIPTSLKMFNGQVFCKDCFKLHVLASLRGEQRVHSNSWWMQFAPGAKPQDVNNQSEEPRESPAPNASEESRRIICSRCLTPVMTPDRVEIGDQCFHTHCARCYCCHRVPKDSVKIYYGQLFCEECFHKHVLGQSRDNPGEFFRNCFEQWQGNPQFAETMQDFMAGNKESTPFVFMMQGQSSCRCGNNQEQEWQTNEPRKSATPPSPELSTDEFAFDLSFENVSDNASIESAATDAAEKIEKLTKFLHLPDERDWCEVELAKWSSNDDWTWCEVILPIMGRDVERACPCLWQCGVMPVRPCIAATAEC